MMRSIYLILFLSIFLLLAGCGEEPECETAADCTAGECFDASCDDGKCTKSPVKDCCGNQMCEDDENECTCSEDCGECTINASQEYFEAKCLDDDSCVMDVKKDEMSSQETSKKLDLRDLEIMTTAAYDSPFNVKKSLFDFEFELVDVDKGVTDIEITKVKLRSKEDRSSFTLGEKDVEKRLWPSGSSIKEEVYVDKSMGEKVKEYPVDAVVNYQYKDDGDLKRDSEDFEIKDRRDPLKFLNPDREYECVEEECDDGNPGTRDSCIEGTAFCEHEPIPGACGNFKCESSESKCTCSKDCGPCEGDQGDYLQFTCNKKNNCVTELRKEKSEKKPYDTKESAYFKLTTNAAINNPIDPEKDKVDLTMTLEDKDEDAVLPLEIKGVTVTDGDNTLADESFSSNNKLSEVYDTLSFSIPFDFSISEYEKEATLRIKVNYEIDYKRNEETNTKRDSFDFDTEQFTMVKVG
ncbi:MAG: hypothetical protein ACQEP1_06560 [Nanobdellota archaeon]